MRPRVRVSPLRPSKAAARRFLLSRRGYRGEHAEKNIAQRESRERMKNKYGEKEKPACSSLGACAKRKARPRSSRAISPLRPSETAARRFLLSRSGYRGEHAEKITAHTICWQSLCRLNMFKLDPYHFLKTLAKSAWIVYNGINNLIDGSLYYRLRGRYDLRPLT